MRKLALLLTLGALLVLQGCGFHLRGKVELSPAMERVYIEGADPVLISELKRALEFSGASMVNSAESATSAVVVDSRYVRDVRTLDSRGLATGYRLRYDVRFTVYDPQGEQRYQSPIISLQRNFDFDATQLLQKEGEEEFLKEDMREQIVQRMLRQLSTI